MPPSDTPRISVLGRLVSENSEAQEGERWRAVRAGEGGALVSRACSRTLPRSSRRGAGGSVLNV